MRKVGRRNIGILAFFLPIISLALTGIIWFSIEGQFLLILFSSVVFSVSFRAMELLESGEDLKRLFSTYSDSLIGEAVGYLHPLFLATALYLYQGSLGEQVQVNQLSVAIVFLLLTYFIMHFESKGELL